jgi:hypothetical protein
MVLFLATLTAAVLLILLSNAREEDRELEFEITLSAVFDRLNQAGTAAAMTPTPAPPLVYGRYPFALRAGSPAYSAAETCDEYILAGSVFDQQGEPTDAFRIMVWGDYVGPQFALTGEVAHQPKGRWTLPLDGMVNRRLWVQLLAAEHYVSAPVEIVLDADNCDQNQVELTFEQTAPLE